MLLGLEDEAPLDPEAVTAGTAALISLRLGSHLGWGRWQRPSARRRPVRRRPLVVLGVRAWGYGFGFEFEVLGVGRAEDPHSFQGVSFSSCLEGSWPSTAPLQPFAHKNRLQVGQLQLKLVASSNPQLKSSLTCHPRFPRVVSRWLTTPGFKTRQGQAFFHGRKYMGVYEDI